MLIDELDREVGGNYFAQPRRLVAELERLGHL
jgi:hypothetical protein